MSVPELVTRCPECRTGFRITAEQLQQRDGRVRCGRCNCIFDARLYRMVRLGAADATEQPAPAGTRAEASMRAGEPSLRPRKAESAVDPVHSSTALDPITPLDPIEMREPMAPLDLDDFTVIRRRRRWLPLLIIFILSLGVLSALSYQFRHVLAARFPVLRPTLLEICATLGCTVQLERALDNLQIESSELRVDEGVLTLVATLRNRGESTLAAPDFDLTLSNDKGQPVLQRRYSAHQYLAGRAELASGIAAGAQIEISVRIDDARADAVGYLMRLVNQ